MKGTRLPDKITPPDEVILGPGEYCKVTNAYTAPPVTEWYCFPPESAMWPKTYLGRLGNHTVVENPDGTITVSPSIRCSIQLWDDKEPRTTWHGFLVNGDWQECG